MSSIRNHSLTYIAQAGRSIQAGVEASQINAITISTQPFGVAQNSQDILAYTRKTARPIHCWFFNTSQLGHLVSSSPVQLTGRCWQHSSNHGRRRFRSLGTRWYNSSCPRRITDCSTYCIRYMQHRPADTIDKHLDLAVQRHSPHPPQSCMTRQHQSHLRSTRLGSDCPTLTSQMYFLELTRFCTAYQADHSLLPSGSFACRNSWYAGFHCQPRLSGGNSLGQRSPGLVEELQTILDSVQCQCSWLPPRKHSQQIEWEL
jgi:hypothetical protein